MECYEYVTVIEVKDLAFLGIGQRFGEGGVLAAIAHRLDIARGQDSNGFSGQDVIPCA